MDRIQRRRQAAVNRWETQKKERMVLTDPLFNVREILKQMVLVEDHLNHPYKTCPDCIRKHLLTIEALAEEASSLDSPNGVFTDASEGLAESARQWLEGFQYKVAPAAIADQIRKLRKTLTPLACDPRSTLERIAYVHLRRGACSH